MDGGVGALVQEAPGILPTQTSFTTNNEYQDVEQVLENNSGCCHKRVMLCKIMIEVKRFFHDSMMSFSMIHCGLSIKLTLPWDFSWIGTSIISRGGVTMKLQRSTTKRTPPATAYFSYTRSYTFTTICQKSSKPN
jgi:hypothetical protein